MKKLLPFIFLITTPFGSCSRVKADITQKFTTSAQISVDMPYSVTNKLGTTYSISAGVPALIQTDKAITTAGSAFSLTEAVTMGDATPSAVTPSSGIAALPHLSGQTTVGSGGTLGSGAMTSLSSGVHTCSGAFGSGSSCVGSTTVTIQID